MAVVTEDVLKLLVGNDPKLLIISKTILNEQIIFNSFNRALLILAYAKSEESLLAVEAGLQMTIDDVRSLNANKSLYTDNKKTALYLYALQNLIFRLSNWRFKNGKRNHYTPVILKKYQTILLKGRALGVTEEVVHNECYNLQYQDKNDVSLAHFEFLDEQYMEAFTRRLRKYRLTKDPFDLFAFSQDENHVLANQSLNLGSLVTINENILDKIIVFIAQQLGQSSLKSQHIVTNLDHFLASLQTVVGSNDEHLLGKIADLVLQRVMMLEATKPLKMTKIKAEFKDDVNIK